MASATPAGPIPVALLDDYDVVHIGVAHLFDQYRDRILVAQIDTNENVDDVVDIALYDVRPTRIRRR